MTFGLCIKVKVVEIKKDCFLTYVAVLFADKNTKRFCLAGNTSRLLSRIVSIGKSKKGITIVYSPDSISYVVRNDIILSDDVFNKVEKVKKDTDDFTVKDRIVTDKKTRLMWLDSCLYQTKKAGNRLDKFSFGFALKMKNTFNQQGGYGNYTDWRIPTADELKDLVRRKYMLNNLNASDGKYWTSSTIVTAGPYYDTYVYTYVNMNAGNVKNASLHEMCKVRLVRGGR